MDNNLFTNVPSLFSLDKKEKRNNQVAPTQKLNIEPDFDQPYRAWQQNQSPAHNDMIVEKVQPIIDSALKTYVGQDVPPSVRLQAKRMALDGLKSYDPSKSKLKTHLMWHLQGLKRAAAKSNQILNVPERVRLDGNYVNTSFNELSDKLGRDPSDSELADYTGLSINRIQKVRSYKPGLSEGAASQVYTNEDGDSISDPASRIPGMDSGGAWRDFVYDGLDDRSKLIMEHTFGMNGKKILDNIGIAGKLRITPARVSQIRADIQKKMDSRGRLGLL